MKRPRKEILRSFSKSSLGQWDFAETPRGTRSSPHRQPGGPVCGVVRRCARDSPDHRHRATTMPTELLEDMQRVAEWLENNKDPEYHGTWAPKFRADP